MGSTNVAKKLAWFGVGLGLAELLAPKAVACATGLEKHADTIQAFGIREIASGVMMLGAANAEDWIWTRVVGDALDGGLLARGLGADNPHRLRTVAAAMAVAPVVMLDILCALNHARHAKPGAISRVRSE